MLRSLIRYSLKSRFLVLAAAVAVVGFGVARMRHMPVDVLPEFSLPYVEIQTESLGLSAEEVEELITVPMEQDLLNGVPWLQTIQSESAPGVSSIVMVFEPGTDLMRARQMVSERMTQAVALPHVSAPPMMLQPVSSTSRMMIIGLSSAKLTPIQMSVLAHWTIAPRLMGVPGVANVAIWGERERQLQVHVDPKRMQAKDVSLLKVLETTGNALWVSSLSFVEASTPGTGGFIETKQQRLGIRHILPIVSPEGLSRMPIEGTMHRLGDVADVVEDHQPLIGDAITKDGPGLLLVIEKFPGANTADVTKGVEEAFSELAPGLPGMNIDTNVFRPADFIETATRHLGLSALIGLLLVVLVVGAYFFAWRTALIALVAIPLALLAGGFVFSLTGATLNVIVLTGFVIAVGVAVSSAINDVEELTRRLREERAGAAPRSRFAILLEACAATRTPMIYATLVLLLAVVPIFFIDGSSGAFFRPLAMSYGLAVLASLLVGMTVTPVLALILGPDGERRPSPWSAALHGAYDRAVSGFVGRGGLAFLAVALLTVAAVALVPRLNHSVLPPFQERNLVIDLECVPGTSQPEMSRISSRVSVELRALPGVHDVAVHVGRAVRGDQVVNVNAAELWVSMDPQANYAVTANAIQDVVDNYPGVRHDVRSYLREKSSDVIAEPDDKVTVRVYGDDENVLPGEAAKVRSAIGSVPGVVACRIDTPIRQATLETRVDIEAAQHYGLKPGDVRRAEATLVSGMHVGSLFEEQKVFGVVVWSTPETRKTLSSISDLMIDTPSGGHVRLGDVAHVKLLPTASVIRHDEVKRYLDVISEVEGRPLAAVAKDIEHRVRAIPFALEYHAKVVGDYGNKHAVDARVLNYWLAAAVAALFLLQAAFGRWRLAALAVLSLPAALSGGVLAAALTKNPTSLGLMAGLLATLGVAVINAILLIRRYQDLERNEGVAPGRELAARGARERFAPVIASALTAIAALLPALAMGSVAGLEIVRPTAIVMVGGLITTVLVDLFFMPAMFSSLAVSAVREHDMLTESVSTRPFGGLAGASAMVRE